MKTEEGIKENISLHYEVYGRGEPLIFLHGAFLNIKHYKEFIIELSKKYKVIAVDLPMHGKSTNAFLDFFDSAKLVHDICEENKIKKPIFCCHSAGCAVAIIYASRYKTKKMYLIAPAGIRFFKHNFEFYSKVLFALPIVSAKFSGIKVLRMYYAGIEFMKKNFKNKKLLELMNKELRENLTCEMNKIICPVTLIWTKEDEVLPFEHSVEFLKNIKKSKILMLHGCHNWPVLTPEKINEIDGL